MFGCSNLKASCSLLTDTSLSCGSEDLNWTNFSTWFTGLPIIYSFWRYYWRVINCINCMSFSGSIFLIFQGVETSPQHRLPPVLNITPIPGELQDERLDRNERALRDMFTESCSSILVHVAVTPKGVIESVTRYHSIRFRLSFWKWISYHIKSKSLISKIRPRILTIPPDIQHDYALKQSKSPQISHIVRCRFQE